ncbi:transcription activator, AraC family protein [Clostridium sartagoforme AAU1]|uniref:Transcription activator, AraC family protein n=1 Tax=Clostridium sartagoforme AAU1 TaxID=1202534 RepID=R9CF78_9CLOT|nr:AraC family transcriptional regulator [Clostridium sartagoforme]EOR28009.1 transcription activator, AraC family protein [Clostridium sartagoforme AAU1]
MDYIQSIQKSIDYMESNILEDINYEDVARYVYMSNYHFHRLFSMITGITANEYIRKRRLSMAGQEISMSDAKVLDISLKYGYDSPESFSKAFMRFHGVTPSIARRSGMELKSFNRLIIKISLEGGTIMDYKIVKKESFKLLTKVKEFRVESISEEDNRDIPNFWNECAESGVLKQLKSNTKKQDIYGACKPISKESKYFDYGIAMEYCGGDIPEGFVVWDVKPTLWGVFKCIGEDEKCIGEMWNRIFNEFLPGSEYVMLDDIDFELYKEENNTDCFCEIWIPVEKK